jgi:pimeloyl-ACP methyl ester carboxylesterase
VLATGGASDDYYAPIADALARRIPGARRVTLPGLRHVAPITDPRPIADLIREQLADA